MAAARGLCCQSADDAIVVVRMLNWPRIEQLVGETVREMGILVVVFAPLDAAFAQDPFDPRTLSAIVAAALTLIGAGIVLESGE